MAKNRSSHMAERKSHGLTYRQLGHEFGMSKSHAHRIVRARERDEDEMRDNPRRDIIVKNGKRVNDMYRDGHHRLGSAED